MLTDRHGNPDHVKILDFGIAKRPLAEGKAKLTQAGTPFRTPEAVVGAALAHPLGGTVGPPPNRLAHVRRRATGVSARDTHGRGPITPTLSA